MDRIRNIIALFRAQLWPIPALFVAGAGGLAYLLLDYGAALSGGGHWWLYSGDAETARDLLGSLLSGMMTMTSLVVSVTFVILTLAANQLGPRLITIFVADRQIQSVLGLFIGTIFYVILVSRTLNDTLGANGVPHMAVTGASALTILCLLALLFYIHKIARLIIADNVVTMVARQAEAHLTDILPGERAAAPPAPAVLSADFGAAAATIGIGKSGYLQVVDYERLVALATREKIQIRVAVRAGHYLLPEGRHVLLYGRDPGEGFTREVRAAFTLGAERTPAQDPEQGIRHLVEIATRALSPGINDPFTAIAVIDHLGTLIAEVLAFGTQPTHLRDDEGIVRVICDRSDLSGILAAALHPIRRAGATHPAILIRLADLLRDLAPFAVREDIPILKDQVLRLRETLEGSDFAPSDRADVCRRLDMAGALLEQVDANEGAESMPGIQS